jgi:ABC-type nitrate/sulfonate/bicarbonate transport system ATPase subunit
MGNDFHIEIRNLRLAIEKLSLIESFDLKLEKGKRIGITGPSGCGKSTLLKTIIRSQLPNGSNSETFSIKEVSESFKIAYLPQSSGLLPWFSLRKNLSIYNTDDLLLTEALEATELTTNLDSYPHNLSGGEQQRALLACNIILRPNMFLADEPLTEIDILRKWKLLGYWSYMIKKFNSSLLIVSHDIDTLLFMCDEILVLSDKPSVVIKHVEINEIEHPRTKDDLINTGFLKYRQILNHLENNI